MDTINKLSAAKAGQDKRSTLDQLFGNPSVAQSQELFLSQPFRMNEWFQASRLYGCIKLSILRHLDIQIFFTLENPRGSKSLFVCGREHIYKYVHRADCLYQTNNLHWHSAMPYAEKASASKPATYYYLIFLIRCNIKLQYVCLFFLLFCCLPQFSALF